jgi:hypothetical protein
MSKTSGNADVRLFHSLLRAGLSRRTYDPLRLPPDRLALPGLTGYRQDHFPDRRSGAEEDLSSSGDNLLAIPSPKRREVPRHPLQDPWCRPWSSPFGKGLDSSSSAMTADRRNDAAGFT